MRINFHYMSCLSVYGNKLVLSYNKLFYIPVISVINELQCTRPLIRPTLCRCRWTESAWEVCGQDSSRSSYSYATATRSGAASRTLSRRCETWSTHHVTSRSATRSMFRRWWRRIRARTNSMGRSWVESSVCTVCLTDCVVSGQGPSPSMFLFHIISYHRSCCS